MKKFKTRHEKKQTVTESHVPFKVSSASKNR